MHPWKYAGFGLFVLTAVVPVLASPRTSCPGTLRSAPVPIAATGKPETRTELVMYGGTPQRNMVNTVDKNVPVSWSVEEGNRKNIKWIAEIGSRCYGGPIIADGKVFVGTTNSRPRDKALVDKKGDPLKKAILMAFNEADGKFLWQIAHGYPEDAGFTEALPQGLCSTPIVEDKRLYYVTPTCEVICADVEGHVKWSYDMMKELKVVPFHLGNCSPLIVGDLVMVCTGNGVDEEGKVPSPKAPSFIAVNKKTGKLAWQSNLPGAKIIEGQWSNPAVAVVNGKPQVIFAGGDCVLYSFEPATGELIWKCNCNPVPKTKESREINPYIVATPVVVGDRLFVGLGLMPDHGATLSYSNFLCVDVTKKGDVSPKSLDVKDAANKNSALVWAFGGMIEPVPKKGRRVHFGKTISTAAVQDGLVYVTEEIGYLHCLDAKTGERYWDHDFKDGVWGSPYWVDGKVYVGVQGGDVVVFAHGKTKKILATNGMDDFIESTPVVAGGVLYVGGKTKLFAIANGK